MADLKEIYNLQDDISIIKHYQAASLSKDWRIGLRIEKGILFGSDEWFSAIKSGIIKHFSVKGVISKVYMTSHNDFAQFDIENDEGITTWIREADIFLYKVGSNVELKYVEQKRKNGIVTKCVIQILQGSVNCSE